MVYLSIRYTFGVRVCVCVCVSFLFYFSTNQFGKVHVSMFGHAKFVISIGVFFLDMAEWDGIGWDDRCIMLDLV